MNNYEQKSNRNMFNNRMSTTYRRCNKHLMQNFIAKTKQCFIWLIIPIIFHHGSICRGESFSSSHDRHLESMPNVTCIMHETKFQCNCQGNKQHMQLPHLEGNVYQVEVTNCEALTIEADTLGETQGLRRVTFKNINRLILQNHALAFPRYASNTGLIVEFEKVNFELIDSHAINGNIEEISFVGGRIEVMRPFAFATFRDRAFLLKLDSVWIRKIEAQAFKKFAVEHIEITNCVFEESVPSKAFYEVDVLNTLRINNIRFHEVHTRAFSFKGVSKLIIATNYFDRTNAEWIEASVLHNIFIRENNFGLANEIAFKAISVNRNYLSSELLELRFINNTIRFEDQPKALFFNPKFTLIISNLQCDNAFDCKDIDTSHKPPQHKIEFFRTHADNIYFTFKPNGKSRSTTDQNYELPLNKLIEKNCSSPSPIWFIVVGSLALVLLLILIIVFVWVYRKKQHDKRKLDIVVPEPRTYKETQIIYQIENAGLLKTDL